MYETRILSIRMKLMHNPRSNDELKDKLHEMFESNNLEFEKMKGLYSGDGRKDIFGKMQFEHNEVEKVKKRMYGDNYEIKPFAYQN